MTSNPAILHQSFLLRQSSVNTDRMNAGDRLALGFVFAGVVAAAVTYITFDIVSRQQIQSHEFIASNVVKPPLYYVAYTAQLVLLLLGGLIALVNTNPKQIERGFILRFTLFIAAAMLMAVRGFSASDWLSTKAVDQTGPFGMFMSVLVFVGTKRKHWVVLEKAMLFLLAVFSIFVVYRMAGLQTFTRQETVGSLGSTLNVLYWPAAWVLLRGHPKNSLANRIKFVPVIIFAIGSLLTQTRLNVVMLLAMLVAYAWLQRTRKRSQSGLWITVGLVAVWAALFAGIFLANSTTLERLQDVSSAFAGRINEDTRTEQLTAFVETVAPSELILGRGSLATWDWDGWEWRSGTDLGYLTLLFFGGLPLLLTYILVHVKPCISKIRSNAPDWQLAGAAVGLLWALRMFSSSYPGTLLDYFPVLFCIGAAISREPSF